MTDKYSYYKVWYDKTNSVTSQTFHSKSEAEQAYDHQGHGVKLERIVVEILRAKNYK